MNLRKMLLVLVLILHACTNVKKDNPVLGSDVLGSTPAPTQSPSVTASPIPPGSDGVVTLELGTINRATPEEITMIRLAAKNLGIVFASKDFAQEVRTFNFSSTDLSSAKVLEKFLNAKFKVNVDMFTGSFTQNRIYHTQGLDVGDGVVYANRYYIKTPFQMMSLMAHELAHELGFHHVSASDSKSVPYGMNYIVEKVAKKLGL